MSAIYDAKVTLCKNFEFINLCFTDPRGAWRKSTFTRSSFEEDVLANGILLDASLEESYRVSHEENVILEPDLNTMRPDPFCVQKTSNVICGLRTADTGMPYGSDSRSIARKTEAHLKSRGIGDIASFCLEIDFFAVSSLNSSIGRPCCQKSETATVPSQDWFYSYETGVDLLPVSHMDSCHDMRSEMLAILMKMGIPVRSHQYLGFNQHRLSLQYGSLVDVADWSQFCKYCIRRTAQSYGKTTTFMPSHLGINRKSGMRIRQSMRRALDKTDRDTSSSSEDFLRHYIGGIIKHSKALRAFTNPSVYSYGGPEVSSSSDGSSFEDRDLCTIHTSHNARGSITVHFPDAVANPYLALSAFSMAGLDGVQNRIEPLGFERATSCEDRTYVSRYRLPVCGSLHEALDCLRENSGFLTAGGVFEDGFIDEYLRLKMDEEKANEDWLNLSRSCGSGDV